MNQKYDDINFSDVKTYSIKDRASRVSIDDIGSPVREGMTFLNFLDSLPNVLAAGDLKKIARTISLAYREEATVAIGIGAHVIKVGLAPLLIDFMKKGIVSALAMNGACIVHDFELAYTGCTSENVAEELANGRFGMAEETGKLLNLAIRDGVEHGSGIGKAVGEMINREELPYASHSILAAAAKLNIPATVHVGIGTDIIHMSPHVDGAALGEGSLTDFKTFTSVVSRLEGGVYLNIGSAVMLPEVFLKALTLARNLGYKVDTFTTVNMDFIQHYRPLTNVVKRPTGAAGAGYALTGHHEIMLPLLFAAVTEELSGRLVQSPNA